MAASWRTRASLPQSRSSLAVGVIGDHIYAVGGRSLPGRNKTAIAMLTEAYNAVNNTWTSKASMPTARSDLAVGVLHGRIFAVGGVFEFRSAAFECYDPTDDWWTRLKPMPTARASLGAVGIPHLHELWAIGGAGSTWLSTVEIYEPRTGAWSSGPPLDQPRASLAVALAGSTVFAVGGFNDASALGIVEACDTASKRCSSWARRAPMPTPRWGLALGATAGGERLFAVGGFASGEWLTVVEEYDVRGDRWRQLCPMPTARRDLGVGILASGVLAKSATLYAVGGWNGTRQLATVESLRLDSYS